MVTASQRLQNTCKVLAGTDTLLTHPLRGMRRAVQAFYKRFSGLERAQVSDRQGADARRDATSGQFVCFRCPGAGALDQESPGSIPGGATRMPRVSCCTRDGRLAPVLPRTRDVRAPQLRVARGPRS